MSSGSPRIISSNDTVTVQASMAHLFVSVSSCDKSIKNEAKQYTRVIEEECPVTMRLTKAHEKEKKALLGACRGIQQLRDNASAN